MTTSGSTTWQLTRDQLIAAALRKLGVLAKGQTPDTEDLSNGQEALNAVIAELQTVGLPLWERREYTFVPVAGQATYNIGVSQSLNTAFPLKIHQAILRDNTSGSNLEMDIRSIYEYNTLSPAQSSGQPVMLFYQPLINYGVITVWPTPDTSAASTKTVKIIYQAPFQDFTSAGETMDLPKEWHQAVIYSLAATLAPEYGIPLQDRMAVSKEADMHVEKASGFGIEEASMFIQVDYRGKGC